MEIKVEIDGLQRIDRASNAARKAIAEEIGKGLFAVAKKVEGEAKRSILNGQKSGRIYQRRSVTHQASAPGESPASDTGRLVNSINGTVETAKAEAVVKAGSGAVKYARMLEFGTSKMAARPFFFPAVEKSRPWIIERLNKSLRDGLLKVVRR